MASERDYYQVLGVLETATTDEIKKAFRRLAKQYHPDRNPGKPQAAGRFKEINEAHDVLSDPAKRKQYDQLRKYGALAGAGRYGGAGRGPGPGRGGGGGPADSGVEFDLSDLGSFGGLGDLFSSIFGKRGEGRMEEAEDEVEATVSIPFRGAALGGKVPVTLPMAEVCPRGGGDGAAPGATISVCPDGNGGGTVSFGRGGLAVNRPGPVCRGRGDVAHRGPGHREERPSRRSIRGSAGRDPGPAHAGAATGCAGLRGKGGAQVLARRSSSAAIASALVGQALVNSTDPCTAGSTASREMARNPKRGKNPPAVSVSRYTVRILRRRASASAWRVSSWPSPRPRSPGPTPTGRSHAPRPYSPRAAPTPTG